MARPASEPASVTGAAGRDDAVTAGRGFLVIAAAKLYFIVASALIALGLPRLLGDPALFGEFKVVSSLLTVLNMVLITGTIQTVSRLVSAEEPRARAIRSTAVRVQLILGGVLAGGLAVFAEPVSALAFRDPSLATYVRVGAGVVFLYSLYAVFIGLINGRKQFATQARLDALFSTLKVSLIVGLVVLGFGVLGAFVGFVTAALLTVVAAGFASARGLPGDDARPLRVRGMLWLMAPILGSTLMINLALQLDVLAIKGLMHGPVTRQLAQPGGPAAVAALLGLPDAAAPDLAKLATDRLAGFFGGAKNIALLPYQATFALTFVVFPLLSRSVFEGDRARTASYVRQALRFTAVVAGGISATLMTVSEPMLTIILGAGYGISATALSMLLVSTVLLALIVLSVTVLNAAGAERRALLITTGTVLLCGTLLFALLRTSPDVGRSALNRAALAGLIGLGAGFGACALELHRRFGAGIPVATLLRLAGVGAGVVALAALWPVTSLVMLIVKSAACGLLVAAGMTLAGELSAADRAALIRIVGRRSR